MYAVTGLDRGDGSFARRCVCAGHKKEGGAKHCDVPNIDADMVEAMFVSSLRLLLLDRAAEYGGAARSAGRRELRAAAIAGDEERVGAALERMFAEAQPQLRASTLSRRRARARRRRPLRALG
jgi:hypothetical protein